MINACNPNTLKAEAGVRGRPSIPFQKTKQTTTEVQNLAGKKSLRTSSGNQWGY